MEAIWAPKVENWSLFLKHRITDRAIKEKEKQRKKEKKKKKHLHASGQ